MKFYGQWNPQVDRVLYENYFKNKKKGFFIECGAYDGVSLSCCKFFEDNLGWTGINVEPAKNHYNKLVKNRPKSINVNLGLSDKNDIMEFKNVISKGAGGGNGSFEHSEAHLEELKGYGVDFDEYKVPTITYSKMLDDHNVGHVDLMCLDVEGFEFKVVDGMCDAASLPEVLCIEYSYLGLKNLIDHVKDMGYVFDFISHNNAYFHHSQSSFNKKPKWFGETNKECFVVDGKISWKKLNL